MKQFAGVYLMIAGILMGFYLLFGVYVPSRLPVSRLPVVIPQTEAAAPLVLLASSKYERPKKDSAGPKPLFSIPDGLIAEVDFWKKIYSVYTTDEAVLHDPDNLKKVYGVITLPHCDDPPTKECLKTREDVMEQEKKRLIGEKDIKIRAQVGQKDRFLLGILASEKYLKDIEKVFSEYDIPSELSRLPFVESMFNLDAYSRSGAAGIWQLMPSTARMLGLKVNRNMDERKDPIKSTYAAAHHLMRDFKRLGAWDLAINAYNSGPSRLADAVHKLGTKNIVRIINNYNHPAYGFAARNFYPCFLAVLDVYESHKKEYLSVREGKQ